MFVYIVFCSDYSLYTGIAKDPIKRITMHNAKKGAKYTRSRTPVTLIHIESYASQSEALKREYQIKQLSNKLSIIDPQIAQAISQVKKLCSQNKIEPLLKIINQFQVDFEQKKL